MNDIKSIFKYWQHADSQLYLPNYKAQPDALKTTIPASVKMASSNFMEYGYNRDEKSTEVSAAIR
jgi:hypothetical protein